MGRQETTGRVRRHIQLRVLLAIKGKAQHDQKAMHQLP